MTVITDVREPDDRIWREFGRLAELAASAVDERDAGLVDDRLATALAALGSRASEAAGPLGAAEFDRLVDTVRDVARPLHRRVAALAALHRTLRLIRLTTACP